MTRNHYDIGHTRGMIVASWKLGWLGLGSQSERCDNLECLEHCLTNTLRHIKLLESVSGRYPASNLLPILQDLEHHSSTNGN